MASPTTLSLPPTGDPTTDQNNRRVMQAVNELGRQLRAVNGAPPTVTGSRGGNAALQSLLAALASLGLIVDKTTA
jgi:hypothetical protein